MPSKSISNKVSHHVILDKEYNILEFIEKDSNGKKLHHEKYNEDGQMTYLKDSDGYWKKIFYEKGVMVNWYDKNHTEYDPSYRRKLRNRLKAVM